MDNKEKRTPILAHNPYRNVLMNVEPLFKLLKTYHIDDILGIADRSIKLVALTSESDFISEYERKEALVFLYEIRDLLMTMKECQITTGN